MPSSEYEEYQTHLCRVCGYYSEDPPWGEDGCCPTYEYCPCCGVEWGYQDSLPSSAARFRADWLNRGGVWQDPHVVPDGLTVAERLSRIGVDLASIEEQS